MQFKYLLCSFISCIIVAADSAEISRSLLEKNTEETDQYWFSKFGTVWKTETFDFWTSPYKDHIVNGISRFQISDEESFVRDITSITEYAKKIRYRFHGP